MPDQTMQNRKSIALRERKREREREREREKEREKLRMDHSFSIQFRSWLNNNNAKSC